MRFFSGFSLRGEESLFEGYLQKSDYTVAGFSKGAIDAFEYALSSGERIDTLQLISPAFFMEKGEAFKRAQIHYFQKNPEAYIEQFLQNCVWPSARDLHPFLRPGTREELEKLLNYRWPEEGLQELRDRGIRIELFLGGRDKIIDSTQAEAFFKPYATVYFIKEGGHILNG